MKKIWRNRGAAKAQPKKFFFVMLLIFLISAGVSYLYFKPLLSSKASVESYSSKAQTDITNKGEKEPAPTLYKSGGEEESSLNEPALSGDSGLSGAENAIKKYLEQYNTGLIDLYMDNSGIVYVDIGDEIKRDFKGDASDELKIIAGLYRSIEGAVLGFRAVKILINGNEAETLGGHIDISRPVGAEIEGGTGDV
jgi:hypothetical protein